MHVVSAFYTQSQTVSYHQRQQPLFGISEWRAKFSSSDAITNSGSPKNNIGYASSTPTDNTDTLPLLLLPFTPTDIILPGQSTTLQFKHGKYMDIIDESLESYESVVGLSILDEDGLLPYVIVCEVLEETLEVNMGYRGFSSMQVGVRAVGRARRIMGDGLLKTLSSDDVSFHGRTAGCPLHLGEFVEWHDSEMTDDEFEAASKCLATIEDILMLSSSQKYDGKNKNSPELDDRMQRQKGLFSTAYEASLEQSASNNNSSLPIYPSYTTNSQRQRHSQLVASSWAAFAAIENAEDGPDARSSAIITQAISTTNTAERLRLGLANLLESQKFGYSGDIAGSKEDADVFQ